MRYSLSDLRVWAFTDEMTGLANSRGLHHGIAKSYQAKMRHFYIAIDLNGFGEAQDKPKRGHLWGDRALRSFADFLRSNVRCGPLRTADTIVARTGGDEFTVALWSEIAARRVAGLVRAWSYRGITASAGIGSTMREADRALYAEKRSKAHKSKVNSVNAEAARRARRGVS